MIEYRKDEPLAEQVKERLLLYIIENELKTGDKIPNEFDLSEMFNVGRSTVREAVKILIARDILEIRRGAGTFVLKEKEIIEDPLGFAFIEDKRALAMDLLSVRLMLEPEIAQMAATNAREDQVRGLIKQCDLVEDRIRRNLDHTAEDIKFHQMIARCSGNAVIEKLIPIINHGVIVFINVTSSCILKNETIETHREIAEAIKSRDAQSAKYAMQLHLIYNRRRIEEIRKKNTSDVFSRSSTN